MVQGVLAESSLGDRWEPLGLGSAWECLGVLGTAWDHVGPLGTAWDRVGPRGTAWDPWDHMGPLETHVTVGRSVTVGSSRAPAPPV